MQRRIPNSLKLVILAEIICIGLFTWFAMNVQPVTEQGPKRRLAEPPAMVQEDSPKRAKRRIINGELVTVNRSFQIDDLLADGDAYFASVNIQCPLATYTRHEALQLALVPGRRMLLIHRYLLDIEKFAETHPGGRTIEEGVGQPNAAELFMQHHRARVGEQFSSLCIGTISD